MMAWYSLDSSFISAISFCKSHTNKQSEVNHLPDEKIYSVLLNVNHLSGEKLIC
jgi:hypothetical protein